MINDLNWLLFFEPIMEGETVAWWEMLMSGLFWTLGLSVAAGVIAFFVGSLMGVFRTTSSRTLSIIGNHLRGVLSEHSSDCSILYLVFCGA